MKELKIKGSRIFCPVCPVLETHKTNKKSLDFWFSQIKDGWVFFCNNNHAFYCLISNENPVFKEIEPFFSVSNFKSEVI